MIRVKHLLSLGVSLCLLALGQAALAAVNVGDKPVLEFQATDGTKVNPQTLKGKIVKFLTAVKKSPPTPRA